MQTVGVDLGGTNIGTVVLDEANAVTGFAKRRTPTGGDHLGVVDVIVAGIHDALDDAGVSPKDIAAIGVGTPGVVVDGTVGDAFNVPGFQERFALADMIGHHVNKPVRVVNDVTAGAVAEHRLGAGRDWQHLLCVFAGTGVGGGLILHGQIFEGAHGGAGEFGHQIIRQGGAVCPCGRRGCVEAYAGRQAMTLAAQRAVADGQQTVLFEVMAKKGKPRPTSGVFSDALDQGEKPFIRPFMIDMASDHFALDISLACDLLDWSPEERINDKLPTLISALKRDPLAWYRANGITPPPWLEAADVRLENPETLREAHEKDYRAQHRAHLWTGWANAGLGLWLLTSPPLLGHVGTWLGLSDLVAGMLLTVLGLLSLSWRLPWVRFAAAGLGCWILFAPLVFWSDSAAAYLNNTAVGMLAVAFALGFPPVPGVSPVAAQTGPTIPKGWDYSPSDWFQRLPVIMLAVVSAVGWSDVWTTPSTVRACSSTSGSSISGASGVPPPR
jgi:predicted NBD/HSP70 family sugar kinase